MIPKASAVSFLPSVLILFALAGPGGPRQAPAAEAPDASARARAAGLLQRLPLPFEPNVGQADGELDYIARSAGYAVALTATEMTLQIDSGTVPASLAEALHSPGAFDLQRDFTGPGKFANGADPLRAHGREGEGETVMLRLIKARSAARAVPGHRLPGHVNYILGNDARLWRRNVPTYASVSYEEVYENIDVVYYGNPQQLEFDFAVKAGGDPDDIRLELSGPTPPRLDAQGNLLLGGSSGQRGVLLLQAPTTYQIAQGVRREIPSRFVIHPDATIGFSLGDYDPSLTVIIDPVMAYSTFLGGNTTDLLLGIAVDTSGSTYVTGYTMSANFPTATPITAARPGGSSDIFVSKINAAGTALVYSTYLGGNGLDHGHAIAVESSGAVTIGGDTSSTNFPLQNPLQPAYGGGSADLFIARLNPSGSALVYSTYLGGSGTEANGSDEAISPMLALDAAGNALITGFTSSADYPTLAAVQGSMGGIIDAVVTKLNPTGSALVFSTYLGGSTIDSGAGIAAGPSGDVYVTGSTDSINFPTQAALDSTFAGGTCGSGVCPDGFITRLNASGTSIVYSTYLGGGAAEEVTAVSVDSTGSAYVTGFTFSPDFPTSVPFQPSKGASGDVFVSKLNPAGSALVYSTFLGGGGLDVALAIQTDSLGRAHLTGYTGSNAYPLANPVKPSRTAAANAFLTILNAAGSSLDFSTYLGGNTLEYGTGVDVDSARNVYVGGFTLSANFPTANPLQPAYGGGTCGAAPNTFPCEDGFVVKYTNVSIPPAVTSLSPSSGMAGGAAFTLTVNGTGFIPTSLVRVGTLSRPTTFVSATQLTAAMPATDLTTPGTLQISVFNGAPDNIASNPLPFTVTSGANAPAVSQGGVVNNASFAASPAPVAPGSIAAIFGQRLTDGSTALSSSFGGDGRLVTTLAGTRVTVNNVPAPIYYATPGQVGVQIPVEVAGQNTASLQVNVGGNLSTPVSINLAPSAPGIFTANQSGSGPGAITHADGSPVTEANPARPGDVVIIYLTGLGALVPAVGTGARAGASATLTPAVVTFNGVAGTVDYSGSAPGFVGLNQVNVRIPEGVLPSNSVQVVVRIGNRESNPVTIAVQ